MRDEHLVLQNCSGREEAGGEGAPDQLGDGLENKKVRIDFCAFAQERERFFAISSPCLTISWFPVLGMDPKAGLVHFGDALCYPDFRRELAEMQEFQRHPSAQDTPQ